MIYGVSRATHVIVGRIERGELVHDALLNLARTENVRNASIRGLGAFELAELVEYDQREKKYRPSQTFECAMEILTLIGNITLKDGAPFIHLHTAVSRELDEEDRRIQCLGGHLVRARAFAVELSIEVYEDLILERVPDEPTGLALWCPSGAPAR